MVYEHNYHGLSVQTGDLLCMTDGDQGDLQGQFWRLLGTLLPGPIDHIVIYLGPNGCCIEAGPAGFVIGFMALHTHYKGEDSLPRRRTAFARQ